MINIVINSVDYHMPTSWSEITVEQVARLHDILQNAGPEIREMFAQEYEPSANQPDEGVETSDRMKIFMAEILTLLCRVPKDIARKTQPDQMIKLVKKHLSGFMVTMIFEPFYSPEKISWDELIYFVAQGVPSEIAYVRAMDICEFMLLINYKIKLIKK